MNKFYLVILMLLGVFSASADISVTFDDNPETAFTELPASMYFTLSEAQSGVPPKYKISCGEYSITRDCTREGSNYARYYMWVQYYVQRDENLWKAIQETGTFDVTITLNNGTELAPVTFKYAKPITVTFDDNPETAFTELPASMYFTLSEAQSGVPPKYKISCGEYSITRDCTRVDRNYARYYLWVQYYVQRDENLWKAIQETGTFDVTITLNNGTELAPVTFKYAKPITVTFDDNPETAFTELPASMYFTLSEDQSGVPPKYKISCGEYSITRDCTREGSNYARYYMWVQYYVQRNENLWKAIQETGTFDVTITLNNGTELAPVTFKYAKPITVTFDDNPETAFTELPASMYFTLSEAQSGVPPKYKISCGEYSITRDCTREGSNYARYYMWVQYYVQRNENLWKAIQETGTFDVTITLNNGTELAPVTFKYAKPAVEVTSTFDIPAFSIFAGIPEKLPFTLSEAAQGKSFTLKVNEETVATIADGEEGINFHADLSTLNDQIKSVIITDGQFTAQVFDADKAISPLTTYYVVDKNLSWTPKEGSEDGRIFAAMPEKLEYTTSQALPAEGLTNAGILLSESVPATLPETWDIDLNLSDGNAYSVDGTDVTFDISKISADDMQKIIDAGHFTVVLRTYNHILSASYRVVIRKSDVTLGYCDELGETYMQHGYEGTGVVVGGAIRIPGSKLKGMKGGVITKMEFAVKPGLQRVYAWIRPSLSEPAVILQKVENTNDNGWTEVVFEKPYVISGDEIYIGYSGYQPKDVKAILTGGKDRPDGCYLGVKDVWDDFSAKGYGTLYIRAYGEANMPETDLGIDFISMDADYYKKDATANVNITLVNSGVSPINSYSIGYTIDGGDPTTMEYSEALASEARKDITFALPVASLEDGMHTVTVTCKANATSEDVVTDNDSLSADFGIYTESYKRNILMEQFTGITCPNCPNGERSIKKAIAGRDNIVWLAHHVGFEKDEFTINESNAFLDYGVIGAPSLMLDRRYIPSSSSSTPAFTIGWTNTDNGGKYIGGYLDYCNSIPAFIGVNVTNSYDPETRELSYTVTGEKNSIFDAFYPESNVTVFLSEDNLKGHRIQAGADETFLHNHVARAILTPEFGNAIEWNGNSFTIEGTYTLEEGWNPENMNIIAVANKPFNKNNVNDAEVLNSAISKVNVPLGINGISGESGNRFSLVDGSIVASADGCDIEVYSIGGLRLANRDLPAGIYLVKVSDGVTSNVYKIFVK